jgi:flagellar basal-body rod protein FlgF
MITYIRNEHKIDLAKPLRFRNTIVCQRPNILDRFGGKMTGFSDLATSLLISAQQRLDVTARNVSNLSTPGYLSRKTFQRTMDVRHELPVVLVSQPDSAKTATLKVTGNPLDIAITGGGALLVRDGETLVSIISGQFSRDGDGRLIDTAGRALQSTGGGDIILSGDAPSILQDGTILIDGQAEARIGAFATSRSGVAEVDPASGEVPDAAEGSVLHQGMSIPSDVDLAAEMIEVARAAQMAQTGARIFQIYDDLMGRVTSKIGESAR